MDNRDEQRLSKMNCKELFALLSRYVDADLPPGACAEIDRHLEGCDPCVSFVNTLRKTAELCRKYEPAELPRPISDKVRDELRGAYQAALARRKSR